jgi:hypothetical protein
MILLEPAFLEARLTTRFIANSSRFPSEQLADVLSTNETAKASFAEKFDVMVLQRKRLIYHAGCRFLRTYNNHVHKFELNKCMQLRCVSYLLHY